MIRRIFKKTIPSCAICKERMQPNNPYVKCSHCTTALHIHCEKEVREREQREFTACPVCLGIGCLLIDVMKK